VKLHTSPEFLSPTLFLPTSPVSGHSPIMAASQQDVQVNNEDQDDSSTTDADSLIRSNDPLHPANRISDLCRRFYTLGWVTGTGGGVSIRHGNHIFLAPSGVQKEMMQPTDMFVMDFQTKQYVRRPQVRQRLYPL